MFRLLLATVSAVTLLASAGYAKDFPTFPDPNMTPGSVCEKPTEYRYGERIAYCERDVETSLKNEIIRIYDETFGYRIRQMDRQAFKIDHYIPLCMGGSNERSNLWPQHRTVFQKTDILEQRLCEKLNTGSLKQADAIDMIKHAKNNLDEIEEMLDIVEAL